MKPRLLILLALAGGMAVFLATRAAAPPEKETPLNQGMTPEEKARISDSKKRLGDFPLPGEEPGIDPEFDIQLEVDPTGEKNRLFFYVTEAHGYYVETFDLEFYYMKDSDTSCDDAPQIASMRLEDYLEANGTLRGCIDVTNNELSRVGGVMGTTENWCAAVVDYGRARIVNPDKFPPINATGKCR